MYSFEPRPPNPSAGRYFTDVQKNNNILCLSGGICSTACHTTIIRTSMFTIYYLLAYFGSGSKNQSFFKTSFIYWVLKRMLLSGGPKQSTNWEWSSSTKMNKSKAKYGLKLYWVHYQQFLGWYVLTKLWRFILSNKVSQEKEIACLENTHVLPLTTKFTSSLVTLVNFLLI
jgi:hypothetical protein